MFRFLKKIKWIGLGFVTIIIVCLIIGITKSGIVIEPLLWLFGIVAIIGCGTFIFFKTFTYMTQPKNFFNLSVNGKITSPVFHFGRYVLKYNISVQDEKKKENKVILEKNQTIKLKEKDTEKPFEYLEKRLKIEIDEIEQYLHENYPHCNILKKIIIK